MRDNGSPANARSVAFNRTFIPPAQSITTQCSDTIGKEVLWRNAKSAETTMTKALKFESAAARMSLTASNALFTPLHRLARIAIARSSATAPRRTAACTAVRIALIRRESQTFAIAHDHVQSAYEE